MATYNKQSCAPYNLTWIFFQIYFRDPFPGISLQMGVYYKAASGGFTKYNETDQHSDKGTYISTQGNTPYCEYLKIKF